MSLSVVSAAKETTRLGLSKTALIVALALLAAVVAVIAWSLPSRGEIAAREQAVKAELAELGALVTMDAQKTYVNSVNFSTLRSPDSLDRAIALLPSLLRLQSLNCSGTALRDEHAQTIGKLGSLQDLVLSHTAITDRALEQLTGLSQLKTFHLADTKVTSAAMPYLGKLRSLNIIDLSGTQVTGNFEPLAKLPRLKWLVAQRLSLDAAAIAALAESPNLGRLSLTGTTCPSEAIDELARQKPNLTIDR